MKKQIFKPGFEFIFSLSLMAILGLPPLVFGQNTKDVTININNGDTTINGKNIKDLSAKDKQEALKDIGNIGNIQVVPDGKNGVQRDIVIKRSNKGDGNSDVIIDGPMGDNPPLAANGEKRVMRFHKRAFDKDSTFTFNYRMNDDRQRKDGEPHRMEVKVWRNDRPGEDGSMAFNRRNTQSFSYTNTDNEGVSTHVSFRVSEPSSENLKRIGHFEGAAFELRDLSIVPEFSAGKTVLMFTLPSKAAAEVQLKDSEGNVLWTDKTINGDFSKSFSLGLNGTYYLQVKQAGKIAVRKIFKEQL
jgi:hypothetical protein